MSSLQERGKSYEDKFAHDESLRFKINARRNKLLGLWAAEKLGKSGDDAAAYAKEVVAADFSAPNGVGVLAKLSADLDAPEEDLRAKMEELLVVARDQVTTE